MNGKRRYIKKICLLGDPAVGKTSLVLRYVRHSFSTKYLATIGAVVYKKEIELKNVVIDLMMWDIAGQETFDGVKQAYFKGAEGAFIVCDVLRDATYEHLEDWISAFYKVQKGAILFFLGNKIDLMKFSPPRVREEDLHFIANKYNTEFFFTSAKDGTNVEKAFSVLAEKIV